ncbi:MAG: alkaline phosphatase family protein [Actinomycetota bacterium]|nr:alkaline phosphatase family protein [Actinomycetota bacterium]
MDDGAERPAASTSVTGASVPEPVGRPRQAGSRGPVLPDYEGACLSGVVPALLGRESAACPEWVPAAARRAEQLVLLVLDGLGYAQMEERRALLPTISSMEGGAITSVAPTTTATALTSLATGLAPADHGVVGYRVATPGGVLNVLRWTTPTGDARSTLPPGIFQPNLPFLGRRCPVVSRAEFAGSGFTEAHLRGTRLVGWRLASSVAVDVASVLAEGEPFVYAYYDGVDKIAHETGLGVHYEAELRAADRLVSELLDVLPAGAALVVTADHGEVEVRDAPIVLTKEIAREVVGLSGEGRFRWLHVAPGASDRVSRRCAHAYGDVAWVRTREEIVSEGWLGPTPPSPEVEARLGDVALVAREPVAFFDPADTGELRLVSRHGSLTAAEMYVPLVAAGR